MVSIYFTLVINHRRTCNPENKEVKLVPASLRPQVLALLNEKGYDSDGNVITNS